MQFAAALEYAAKHILERDAQLGSLPITPTPEAIAASLASLPPSLPAAGLGTVRTTEYLVKDLLPGVLQAQNGPRYFGFVTGGVTPAAQVADVLVGSYDENVQVSLPHTTAAVQIDARTLDLVLDLINISHDTFKGKSITTGATASNILGLACAREYFNTNGFSGSRPPKRAEVVLLSIHPHFSIVKAAQLTGLGSGPAVFGELYADPEHENSFNFEQLEAELRRAREDNRGAIVSIGQGEVNTGSFARNIPKVVELAHSYGAWVHIDAAFGGFAAMLPEYKSVARDMSLADSLTLDGHKWLNVPYDCGLFYTKHAGALPAVFAPPEAPAYLTVAGGGTPAIPSPLYSGIENSRRFRALPLLASLLSLGKDGYTDLISRNVAFARRIAQYLASSPKYELLNPSGPHDVGEVVPLNIVLFRGAPGSSFDPTGATGEAAADRLAEAINATRRMYVSATAWRGNRGVRIAVSNWRTGIDGESDWEEVKRVLEVVME